MEGNNDTGVTEFILLGLTDDPQLQILLFLLFLLFYLATLVGNIGMIALIVSQSRLHSPMYIFLSNLSFSDFCYSSVITPKMLKDLMSEKKTISFTGCAVQQFFFDMFASMEVYLLSVMAYDRYAAICHPLLYSTIINRSMCIKLVTAVYLSGIITAASVTRCTFFASFCASNVIDHFFCDAPPLMKISCSDTFFIEIVIFAVVTFFGLGSLLITGTSYIFIISTILLIPSSTGRLKTFSTCGSHLTALSLFYGTALCTYLRLPGSGTLTQDKVLSVCYTIVIPMLNPFIYSVRNKEVMRVIWKIILKKQFEY